MTVKELIQELNHCDPDQTVEIVIPRHDYCGQEDACRISRVGEAPVTEDGRVIDEDKASDYREIGEDIEYRLVIR